MLLQTYHLKVISPLFAEAYREKREKLLQLLEGAAG
jgi:hypothetical protein